jgi:hypothetical protein
MLPLTIGNRMPQLIVIIVTFSNVKEERNTLSDQRAEYGESRWFNGVIVGM